ncbi:hypothetical protein [Pontibacter chinhatensis]|uniref:Uncharacterized protein n=1 Tax=Pontibacter chinhatensis TaxID=1436961 RepID=A0A1I2YU34_9BACT|nr:hypothetical protein [Pontibacter chinhatensis]SFH29183.1 hypothetical protein SAMN05421739_11013 [Pontibacter chinhatensis]
MEITSKFKTIGYAFILGAFMFACSQETQNETNAEVNEAQTEMNAEIDEAEMETNTAYNDFSAWVDTNTERAETVTKDEYREMRAEYKRREAEVEAESSTWDDETRQAWENTKAEWNEFENKVQKRLGKIDDIDVDVDVNRDNN